MDAKKKFRGEADAVVQARVVLAWPSGGKW